MKSWARDYREKLTARIVANSRRARVENSEDQPRDEHGRFASVGEHVVHLKSRIEASVATKGMPHEEVAQHMAELSKRDAGELSQVAHGIDASPGYGKTKLPTSKKGLLASIESKLHEVRRANESVMV